MISSFIKVFVCAVILKEVTSINNSCADLTCFYGRDGRDGLNGRDGKDGKDCIECKAGPQGEKGETGPKGDMGPKGDVGDRGIQGQKGEHGEHGEHGMDGARGEKGVCDEEKLNELVNGINALRQEVENLKLKTVKLDAQNKIPRSVLPAGFSQVSVADLQMESYHVAAAAACRGSTATGGSGVTNNLVFPRSRGRSCAEVCEATTYRWCDAELSIYGKRIIARSSTDYVGSFYNYGCHFKENNVQFEPDLRANNGRMTMTKYISYCCCRR